MKNKKKERRNLLRRITKRSIFVFHIKDTRSRCSEEPRWPAGRLKGRTEDRIINEKKSTARVNEIWVSTCHVVFTLLGQIATKRGIKRRTNKMKDRSRFSARNIVMYFELVQPSLTVRAFVIAAHLKFFPKDNVPFNLKKQIISLFFSITI